MGFFGSFKKKEDSSNLFPNLPLPPPAPKLEQSAFLLEPSQDALSAPMQPVPQVMSAPPLPVPEPKKPEELPKPMIEERFDIPFDLPKKKQNVPESLPVLPTLTPKLFSKDIPAFSQETILINKDIPKEIPSFNIEEPQEFEELPVMEVLDTEEVYRNEKYSGLKKPLFIRTDHYSEVLSTIDTIKEYVSESADTISVLENLKKNAEMEHKNYKSALEDIQRKLIYIDKILFEKEG